MNHLCPYNYHDELQKPQHLAEKTKATKGKFEGPLYKAAGRFQHMGKEQVSSKRHPRDQRIFVTPRTGSAVARYCPLWAWLHSHQPARFCFWELTKQLPRVVTHPGIAPASNSLNFGVPTNPKPVSSQKASRYEDARCAI
ncbi:hypothetical protein L3X38_001911 [Prunus dulcis]|uniref:Uncharacterized protein n=1 Tax=Prunus dulcis TaxID=3755 RepID=A0AAD4WUH0_PRUDU|nr:hypothetical protein L3X38_001911 [Prunus dulcis]